MNSHTRGAERATARLGRRYVSYRTRSGSRWIFPERYPQRLAGIGMYVPYSLGGHARRLLMLIGAAGTRVDSHSDPVGDLEPLVFAALGRDDVELAWYVGNRRAETKTSALAVDASGRGIAFVKLAQTPTARRSLERERVNLEGLEAAFDGAPPAPRPLAWSVSDVASLLITTAAPSRRGPQRFGQQHVRFLTLLGERFGRRLPVVETPLWEAASDFVNRRYDRASDAWQTRFAWAYEHLGAALANQDIATGLAHRDFAPWNTRAGADGLFAFDWEFASRGYPTLHDYFHFRFMVSLLLRGGASAADARAWLRDAPARQPDASHLLVAYLFDVARQYHGFHEGSPDTPDDAVLRQAARLLDGADTWLHI